MGIRRFFLRFCPPFDGVETGGSGTVSGASYRPPDRPEHNRYSPRFATPGVELLVLLAGMLVVLAVGLGARAAGLLTEPRRELLNAFAYYVALPALIVSATYDQPLSAVVSARLLVGVGIVLAATVALAAAVHRRARPASVRSVAIVQSYHTNLGYLGVPVVATTFGALATARASVVLATGSLLQIALTVLLLSTSNDAETSLAAELRGVAVNPALLAVLVGLAASAAGVSLPATADWGLTRLGDTALPIALLCVGAALTLEAREIEYATVGAVLGVKLVAMPLVALATFLALGAEAATLRAGVAMFAMPTAVSTYVFAAELGGDRELASVNVFATTVGSVATLLVVVRALGIVV